MPNWAWAGYLAPLTIDPAKLDGFLPGRDRQVERPGLLGRLLGRGARDLRAEVGARGERHPHPDAGRALDRDEFDEILAKLKDTGKYEYPLNIGMADKGEWYPYAFLPFLWSFGGDLVDRSTYQTAEGALNGDAAIEWGEWFQGLVKDGMVPGTSQSLADHQNGFADGKYALNWTGNWLALSSLEKFGDDLLFLPAPDFGHGGKIGAASWQFAVSSKSAAPGRGERLHRVRAAGQVLHRLLRRHRADPADPRSAAEASKYYAPGKPMEVFYDLSREAGDAAAGDARATWCRARSSRRRRPTSPTGRTWPRCSIPRSTRSTRTSRTTKATATSELRRLAHACQLLNHLT